MSGWVYYGISNGVGVAFCIVFCLICIIKYKNASYESKLTPLKFLFILLIVLEVAKIVYHIWYAKSYPPQRYPIVFCSLVMYTYPIICYARPEGMASRISKALSVIPCLAIGAMYLFFGFSDVTNANTYSFIMNLHSRFYHFCMLAGAIYIIAVNLYDFRFKDFYFTGLTVGGYFTLCTMLSLFIGGDISYFGPTSAPVQALYNIFGYAVGNIFLSVAAVVISLITFGVACGIKRLYRKRKSNA